MVHVVITLYYDFIEPILTAKKALENAGLFVTGYPMFKFHSDAEELNIRYVDFINYVAVNKPDYVLWWNFYVPTDIIRRVKLASTSTRNYMYNWDDPYCWNLTDYAEKIEHIDVAFVSSTEKMDEYIKNACEPVLLYPGFNKNIHYPIITDDDDDISEYSCDISICCTNLYENDVVYPNQRINRKKLIDELYLNQSIHNYKFHIYGPPFLASLYPNSYKKEIRYVDTNKLFNYSKINICTHVTSGKQYMNERCVLIMASGGLLYVDEEIMTDDINEDNIPYVIIDPSSITEQVVNILSNYQDYSICKYNGYCAVQKYDWDYWAKTIANYMK
jgi:hypothetical protein